MSEAQTFEYAEVVSGFCGRGQGTSILPFMHVRQITGDQTTANLPTAI